jgi:hypothetical protein
VSTTTKAVRQYGLRKLSNLRLPPVGTATGGSATTVVDAAASLTGASTNHFDGLWIKIATDAGGAGASPEGKTRAVAAAGYAASTGTFTTATFTDAVASGDIYELHKYAHPNEWDEIIKEKVRNLYMPTFFPLSLHIMAGDDNDMESAPATNYSTTNGTRANEATIIYNGAQSLKLTATSAGGYANVGTVGVPEGLNLVTAVNLYVTSGDSGTFRVVDVTNTATIEDATSDEPSWIELLYPFTVPSTCEQIDFRFISDANTDIAYWDDWHVWYDSRGVYPLPSWITRREQVVDVVAFPQGQGGPSSDNDYMVNLKRSRPINWGFERENIRATNELFIWADTSWGRPYIIAKRALAEPTSDTSAIFFEPDLLANGVLAEMAERLANHREVPDSERSRYASIARAAKNEWIGGLMKLGLLDPVERRRSNRIMVR